MTMKPVLWGGPPGPQPAPWPAFWARRNSGAKAGQGAGFRPGGPPHKTFCAVILCGVSAFAQTLDIARRSLESGDLARAERELQQVLQANPRSAEAHFLLGVTYSQKGDPTKAKASLLQALKLQPNSIPALNNLGVNALQRGDEAGAESYFQRTLKLAPNDPDAAFNLGLLDLKYKRFSQAAERLSKVTATRPDDLAVLHGLLEAHMALASPAAVGETTSRILKLAPKDPRFYFQLASALSEKGFHEPALRVLESARSLWPDSSDAAYNLAVVSFRAGRYDAGRALVESELRRGERGELHELLGDIYEKLGRYGRAVEHYQAAARLEPEREEYYFALGYEFLIHHNFELAEEIFAKAAGRLPRSLKVRLGLAAAYFARTKYQEAIDTLKSAIEIAPESDLGYSFLARAFLLLADHEELFAGNWAAHTFQQYIKLKPQDPFPYYVTAVSLRGNRPESLRLLQRSLELNPKFAEAYLELGKQYFASEKYQEAIAALTKAVEIKPALVEAHYRLSRAHAKAGNAEKARQTAGVFQKLQKEQDSQAVQREKEILRFVYSLQPEPR